MATKQDLIQQIISEARVKFPAVEKAAVDGIKSLLTDVTSDLKRSEILETAKSLIESQTQSSNSENEKQD